MRENKVKSPVMMKEGKVSGISGFLNLALEYLLFYRWVFFKNRPRGNLLLIRSLLVVGTLAGIYYSTVGQIELVLEGIEVDPVILFGFAAVVGFWYMSSVFHKKSASCTDMQNDYLRASCDANQYKSEVLGAALSNHLLSLDLWAHRSFARHFARTLEHAIRTLVNREDAPQEFRDLALKRKWSSADDVIDYANGGHLQNKDARVIFNAYQDFVLEQAGNAHDSIPTITRKTKKAA